MKAIFVAALAVCLGACSSPQGITQFRNTTTIYEEGLQSFEGSSNGFAKARVSRGANTVGQDTFYPIVNAKTYNEIVAFNHLMAAEFLRAADDARRLGKYGNGVLILSAVAFGIGTEQALKATVLNRRLIAGLGLSEGIRYIGPNVSSRAFLTAAEQSSCIARAAREKTPTDKGAAEVWEVMTIVQADLRRNLLRRHVNLSTIAVGFLTPRSFEESDYDTSRTHQRLRAHAQQEKESNKTTLRYKLFGCLVQETSGDQKTP